MAEEELDAIQAIYCGPNEFILQQKDISNKSTVFTLNVNSDSKNDSYVKISITFTLGPEYPKVIPQISIQCIAITREASNKLKEGCEAYMRTLSHQNMIMDAVLWVQENAFDYMTPKDSRADELTKCSAKHVLETSGLQTALLHLDHMRAKARYTKTIHKWTEELGLTGALLFWEKFIFIILEGSKDDVKEYIVRQKTVNVDVDSKGRNCKERMLSVICQEPLLEKRRFINFEVLECSTVHEFQSVFYDNHIGHLYDNFIYGAFIKRT